MVKLVNWVIWEKAQSRFTKNIDFNELGDDDGSKVVEVGGDPRVNN